MQGRLDRREGVVTSLPLGGIGAANCWTAAAAVMITSAATAAPGTGVGTPTLTGVHPRTNHDFQPTKPSNEERGVSLPMVERGSYTADAVAVDDAVLVRRVAAGGECAAVEELYRRYERRVYEFGLRLLGDRELAGELVQETFLRLWQTADRFEDSRGNAAAYLFTLARHLAVDLWRRPSSRPFEPERPEASAPTKTHDATDAMLTRVVVEQALDALSPAHREVLMLSYRGELTQPVIAEILGIPLGTVKTRTYHALRALKLALAERGVHGDASGSAS